MKGVMFRYMKEIGAIFVVSISEIRTVQLAAIKRRYNNY